MNVSPQTCLLLFIVALLSCNSKDQQQRLMESAERLQKQNEIAWMANRMSESRINHIFFESYSSDRYEYLQPAVKYYIENAMRFDDLISEAIQTNNAGDSMALFNQYQALQQSYRSLKQLISDSLTYVRWDTNSNVFMNMNEKTFIHKYGSARDSINTKLQLLFLQADAIWNEHSFFEKLESPFKEWKDRHDYTTTLARPDKIVYKRGEKMKLTACLATIADRRIKYAIIDGKKVQPTNDEYQYSRKITEKRGLHKLLFIVYAAGNGKSEPYSVAVEYKVE